MIGWGQEEWREAERQWQADGFLSEAANQAERAIVKAHGDWFTLADNLNKVGQAVFLEASVRIGGKSTHDPEPIAVRLTLRALSTFQGVVLLSRRGMAAEAFTLARNLYEIAFWLGYLATDPKNAADSFVDDEKLSRLSSLKLDRECHNIGVHNLDQNTLKNIESAIVGAGKISKLDLKEVAKRGSLLDHYRVYKMLSMKYAHASIGSLHPLLEQKLDGTVGGHLIGPDETLAGEALQCGSIAFGICIATFSELLGGTAQNGDLENLLKQTDSLRQHG